MDEKSLEFNLIIKTESDKAAEISGLDIDFDIVKTKTSENNKALLTVWNLNDNLYQTLTEKNDKICIYASYDAEEQILCFRGSIQKIEKRKAPGCADIPVYIELSDGRQAYTNAFMNKNYRGSVTSTAIIKDCISAMGLSTGTMSSKLPERTYDSYKAKGPAHTILQKICRTLGAQFSIQNDLVNIVTPNDEPVEETAFELNIENSMTPRRTGFDETVIQTGFAPHINPNSSVKCNFTEISGLRVVKRVHSFGNNYGKTIITEITV